MNDLMRTHQALCTPFVNDDLFRRAFGAGRANVGTIARYLATPIPDRPVLSFYFDAAYYRDTYPDVADADIDPLLHFIETGVLEERSPHPLVDLKYILSGDAGLLGNPPQIELLVELLEYDLTMPSPYFDPAYYRAQLRANAPDNALLRHFLTVGLWGRHQPNAWLDPYWYADYYLDSPKDPYSALRHFIQVGDPEGRAASRDFDGRQYLAHNPDVAAAGEAPLRHFLTQGRAEGRAATPLPTMHAPGRAAAVEAEDAPQPMIGSFDTLSGALATGWAYDPINPAAPTVVDFFVGGALVGSTTASLPRHDVRMAGFGDGRSGFWVTLDLKPTAGGPTEVEARVRNSGRKLENSPRLFALSPLTKRWLRRRERAAGPLLERLRRRCDHAVGDVQLSIVMPVYNTPEPWLREAIESVLAQWCRRWTLYCVDDGSTAPHVAALLDDYAARDERVRIVRMSQNGGIAKATNAGLLAAQGDYVALMDHDDVLEPDAVYWLLKAANTGADLIYSDEIITGESSSSVIQLCARPSFSYDYYLSHPYFVHMVCMRRSLAERIGGWDETLHISGDVDFVLRALEHARTVAHVAAPLYRWRTHASSTGHERQDDVMEATQAALRRHLARIGADAKVTPGPHFNHYRLDYADDSGRVLVIVPTKNRVDLLKPCIDSLLATTQRDQVRLVVIDHASDDPDTKIYLDSLKGVAEVMPYAGPFNYSAMNNAAFRQYRAGCPYILLLNNDVEAIEPGWLEHMRGLARRPEVGAVGATLLYAGDTVQHSGVVLGLHGVADHAHKFQLFAQPNGDRNPGYLGSLISIRDYSAVTAACMLLRTEVFDAMAGLDEDLSVGFNDADLCLRIQAAGYKLLNDPFAVLHHYEHSTREQTNEISHPEDNKRFLARWGSQIAAGDRFYNPSLALFGPDHTPTEARQPGQIVRVSTLVRPGPPPARRQDDRRQKSRKKKHRLEPLGSDPIIPKES